MATGTAPSSRDASVGCALLCVLVVLCWEFLTVRYNYGGNWTALFHTGSQRPAPRELAFERVYVFRDSPGYDGQFSHYVAHDPLLRRRWQQSVDSPRLRWRRILVPGAAFLIAYGRQHLVDGAYRLVILTMFFLGSYWLSRFGRHHGLTAGAGLLFLTAPAAIVSADRMTVDVALAAFCTGFAYYATTEQTGKLFAILILAPLAHDAGFGLVAAYGLHGLMRRRWGQTLIAAAAALPSVGWSCYVCRHTGPGLGIDHWLSWKPLQGILTRTLEPAQFPLTSRWLLQTAVLDYCVVLGVWIGLFLAVRLLWRRSWGPLETALAPFLLFAVFVFQPDVWAGGYELGRLMTPLLVLLALEGIAARFWWCLLPLALALPRLLLQLYPLAARIVSALRYNI